MEPRKQRHWRTLTRRSAPDAAGIVEAERDQVMLGEQSFDRPPQNNLRTRGNMTAVSTPLSPIPRLENAPATSLICSARAVPMP